MTDLRTEDSGKLGCRLYAADKHFELLKDFAVTGKCTLSYLSVAFFSMVKIVFFSCLITQEYFEDVLPRLVAVLPPFT